MRRNLSLLGCCLVLLGVSGCGLGGKSYKVESEGDGRVYLAVYNVAGGKIRIGMPANPGSGWTVPKSTITGGETRDGVTYKWEITYEYPRDAGLVIHKVILNGEEIAPR